MTIVEPTFEKTSSVLSNLLITNTFGVVVQDERVTHVILFGSLPAELFFQHSFGIHSVKAIQSTPACSFISFYSQSFLLLLYLD